LTTVSTVVIVQQTFSCHPTCNSLLLVWVTPWLPWVPIYHILWVRHSGRRYSVIATIRVFCVEYKLSWS